MMRPDTAGRQHTRTRERGKKRIPGPHLCQKAVGKSRVLPCGSHRPRGRFAGSARKGTSASRARAIPLELPSRQPKILGIRAICARPCRPERRGAYRIGWSITELMVGSAARRMTRADLTRREGLGAAGAAVIRVCELQIWLLAMNIVEHLNRDRSSHHGLLER